MKKILLASTALIASAGFAAAEVVVGGDGYFGVMYLEDGYTSIAADDVVTDYSFAYDLDFDITASGTSDSGLTFGAKIDIDDAAGAQGGFDAPGSEGSIFISGDFGTLTMGDIDGAAEKVVGDLAGVGLTGLGDANETTFIMGDTSDFDDVRFPTAAQAAQDLVARYDYSVSGITLSLGLNDEEGYSVGAGYATDLFAVGIGYESQAVGSRVAVPAVAAVPGNAGTAAIPARNSGTATHIVGSASVTFSGVTLKGLYGQFDGDNLLADLDQYGVSADAAFGAASVSAFYRVLAIDAFGAAAARDDQVYGLGVAYDLGGGLALEAGIAQFDPDVPGQDSTAAADFGVSINF